MEPNKERASLMKENEAVGEKSPAENPPGIPGAANGATSATGGLNRVASFAKACNSASEICPANGVIASTPSDEKFVGGVTGTALTGIVAGKTVGGAVGIVAGRLNPPDDIR